MMERCIDFSVVGCGKPLRLFLTLALLWLPTQITIFRRRSEVTQARYLAYRGDCEHVT